MCVLRLQGRRTRSTRCIITVIGSKDHLVTLLSGTLHRMSCTREIYVHVEARIASRKLKRAHRLWALSEHFGRLSILHNLIPLSIQMRPFDVALRPYPQDIQHSVVSFFIKAGVLSEECLMVTVMDRLR